MRINPAGLKAADYPPRYAASIMDQVGDTHGSYRHC